MRAVPRSSVVNRLGPWIRAAMAFSTVSLMPGDFSQSWDVSAVLQPVTRHVCSVDVNQRITLLPVLAQGCQGVSPEVVGVTVASSFVNLLARPRLERTIMTSSHDSRTPMPGVHAPWRLIIYYNDD